MSSFDKLPLTRLTSRLFSIGNGLTLYVVAFHLSVLRPCIWFYRARLVSAPCPASVALLAIASAMCPQKSYSIFIATRAAKSYIRRQQCCRRMYVCTASMQTSSSCVDSTQDDEKYVFPGRVRWVTYSSHAHFQNHFLCIRSEQLFLKYHKTEFRCDTVIAVT